MKHTKELFAGTDIIIKFDPEDPKKYTVGWKKLIDGHMYGDYIIVYDEDFDETLKRWIPVAAEQIRDLSETIRENRSELDYEFGPCQRCGKNTGVIFDYTRGKITKHRIYCENCGSKTDYFDSLEETKNAWNEGRFKY